MNNLQSEVENMMNKDNETQELYNDMDDFNEGLHQNTTENNDSFNVHLNDFNKEKSSNSQVKKPRN